VIAIGYKPDVLNIRRKPEPAPAAISAAPAPVVRAEALPITRREDLDVPAFMRRRNEAASR
jgi:hypothetical protein